MLLAVTPLPKPLTTPPVTSTYFIFYGMMHSWDNISVHNVLGVSYQQHNHRNILHSIWNELIPVSNWMIDAALDVFALWIDEEDCHCFCCNTQAREPLRDPCFRQSN